MTKDNQQAKTDAAHKRTMRHVRRERNEAFCRLNEIKIYRALLIAGTQAKWESNAQKEAFIAAFTARQKKNN